MLLIKLATRLPFPNLVKRLEHRNRNKFLQQFLHQIEAYKLLSTVIRKRV